MSVVWGSRSGPFDVWRGGGRDFGYVILNKYISQAYLKQEEFMHTTSEKKNKKYYMEEKYQAKA